MGCFVECVSFVEVFLIEVDLCEMYLSGVVGVLVECFLELFGCFVEVLIELED